MATEAVTQRMSSEVTDRQDLLFDGETNLLHALKFFYFIYLFSC